MNHVGNVVDKLDLSANVLLMCNVLKTMSLCLNDSACGNCKQRVYSDGNSIPENP